MTPDEIKSQLDNFRPRSGRTYPALPDIAAALRDFVLMKAHRAVSDPEPLATQWRRDGLSIHEIRSSVPLSSADFAGAMENSQTKLLQESFEDFTADIRAISQPLELDNFLPTNLPVLTMGAPGEVPEDSDLKRLPVSVIEAEQQGVLRTFGAKISFSKPVFFSYGAEILESLSRYAQVFALIEMQIIATLLESATLATSASTGLDSTGLAKASAGLRTQVNDAGQLTGLPLAVLIVPPLLEVPAWVLRETTGAPLTIICNPYLSSPTTWYALTRPELAAPLRRLRLRGAGLPRLFLNQRRGIESGAEFALEHTVNFAVLNSNGILKCTS